MSTKTKTENPAPITVGPEVVKAIADAQAAAARQVELERENLYTGPTRRFRRLEGMAVVKHPGTRASKADAPRIPRDAFIFPGQILELVAGDAPIEGTPENPNVFNGVRSTWYEEVDADAGPSDRDGLRFAAAKAPLELKTSTAAALAKMLDEKKALLERKRAELAEIEKDVVALEASAEAAVTIADREKVRLGAWIEASGYTEEQLQAALELLNRRPEAEKRHVGPVAANGARVLTSAHDVHVGVEARS